LYRNDEIELTTARTTLKLTEQAEAGMENRMKVKKKKTNLIGSE
jgi:hypothetical protein